jgi:hypothetical protein
MCGLEAYAEASIGSLGVELRKRTTIGVELAAKVSMPLRPHRPANDMPSRNCCFSWMSRHQVSILKVLGASYHF